MAEPLPGSWADPALAEHSRRPVHTPGRTDTAIEAAVVELRDEKGWGGAKLAEVLATRD